MYEITITNAALNYIKDVGTNAYNNKYLVVLVDTHCCGGLLNAEIHTIEKIQSDKNMTLLFSADSIGQIFDIYAVRI